MTYPHGTVGVTEIVQIIWDDEPGENVEPLAEQDVTPRKLRP